MALDLGMDAKDPACRTVVGERPDSIHADPCSHAFAPALDLAQAP